MILSNLPGVKTIETPCQGFEKASEIEQILKRGLAATAAGRSGAINIWKDDSGKYRVESMRFCITQDEQTYTSLKDVKKWAAKWLIEIND